MCTAKKLLDHFEEKGSGRILFADFPNCEQLNNSTDPYLYVRLEP